MGKNSSTTFQDVSFEVADIGSAVVEAQVVLNFRLTLQLQFHSV